MTLPKTFSAGERLFAADLNDNFEQLDDEASRVNAGYVHAGTLYFDSSAQFIKADPFGTGDIGLRAINVQVQAGGGGGGYACAPSGTRDGASGGGAGGYAAKFYLESELDASEDVTVGAGGSGLTMTAGGTSEFKGINCTGGNPGQGNGPTPTEAGTGGGASGGDINSKGGGGGAGSGRVRPPFSGHGGSSALGGGGRALARIDANTPGESGGVGAGGGGGRRSGNCRNGGAGGNGVVIIDCFV